MRTHKKSFTLIEMVIILIIISVLSAALIPRLMSVQARARDLQRKVDVKQLSNGLAIYKVDRGSYPTGAHLTNDFGLGKSMPLVPVYFTSIPMDPLITPYNTNIWDVPMLDWLISTGGSYGYVPMNDGIYPTSNFVQTGGMIVVSRMETLTMANWPGDDGLFRYWVFYYNPSDLLYMGTRALGRNPAAAPGAGYGFVFSISQVINTVCNSMRLDNDSIGVSYIELVTGNTVNPNNICHINPSVQSEVKYILPQK